MTTTTAHANCTHASTKAARAACRKVKATTPSTAALLLAQFDKSWVMHNYLDKACQNFCTGHSTFTRDEEGVGHTDLHHTDRIHCAQALVDADVTFSMICRRFS